MKSIKIIGIGISILLVIFLIVGFANNWNFSAKQESSNSNTQNTPHLKSSISQNDLKSSNSSNDLKSSNSSNDDAEALIDTIDVLINELDELKKKNARVLNKK